MVIARKQLSKIFRERKRDNPHGPNESREEKSFQQQNASMGELIHTPDSSAASAGHRERSTTRCYPEPAWVFSDRPTS